jgi:glucose/arabinose dehydrogenase
MINKKQLLVGLGVLVLAAATIAYFNINRIKQFAFQPNDTSLTPLSSNENSNSTEVKNSEEVVAKDLNIPWEIVFLPDDSMLITERAGNLKHITSGTAIPVSGVAHRGEGGLLGMALHPDFAKNQFIYLYSTTNVGGGLSNRVERYKFANNQLSERKIIIENIPGSSNHDGGRIAFGPDKLLYITTGDAEHSENAQNTSSLAGKILRLRDDGSIPTDNPFNNAIYSYGHRNPQGITWDSDGNLWATEHGPSGAQTGYDELNKIEKGANYGWPNIRGDQAQGGMKTPVYNSGSKETWAPSGITFANGHLIFTGLRGESLYISKLTNSQAGKLSTYLREKYGRLRTVVAGPDGYLYLATNNTDGRGTPTAGDDKIIRLKISF